MSKKVQRLENVLGVLRKRKAEFEATYGVTRIGIFGSLARGEAGLDSDVDIVVEMRKPDLFYMVHVKESLEKELRCPVDIVRYRERMNPFLKSRIEKEALYV